MSQGKLAIFDMDDVLCIYDRAARIDTLAALSGQTIAFLAIAMMATSDDVIPSRPATTRARDDVIDGDIRCRAVDATVLALLPVTKNDVFAIASSTMKILDAKYEKANLDAFLDLSSHLDSKQKIDLKSLLLKYEPLFDGSLGNWKTDPVDLQLKSGEMPFHLSPFPVPKIHKQTFKHFEFCNLRLHRNSNIHLLLYLRKTVLSE